MSWDRSGTVCDKDPGIVVIDQIVGDFSETPEIEADRVGVNDITDDRAGAGARADAAEAVVVHPVVLCGTAVTERNTVAVRMADVGS